MNTSVKQLQQKILSSITKALDDKNYEKIISFSV